MSWLYWFLSQRIITMTDVLLHLDEKTYRLFQRLVREQGSTATDAIRELIERYIEENV